MSAIDPVTEMPMTLKNVPVESTHTLSAQHYLWDGPEYTIDFYVLCYLGDPEDVMGVVLNPSTGGHYYHPVAPGIEPHETLLREAYAAWRGVS